MQSAVGIMVGGMKAVVQCCMLCILCMYNTLRFTAGLRTVCGDMSMSVHVACWTASWDVGPVTLCTSMHGAFSP